MGSRMVGSLGRVFEMRQDMLEATSNHRPRIGWRFTDAAGHEHRWHVAKTGQPAEHYSPREAYDVPSVEWVEESPATDDYPEIGHHECRECRERVVPSFTADDYVQYVPGLRHYWIDGVSVRYEDFKREAEAEFNVKLGAEGE